MVKSIEHDQACDVTGKLRYKTEDVANRAADKARRGRELRAFRCKSCFGWHLTRIKQGDRHAMERSTNKAG